MIDMKLWAFDLHFIY